jgi:hypothetical protein
MALFYGIIFVTMFLGFAVHRLYKKRIKLTVQLGASFLLIISCYLAVNFYWIYPYYLASSSQVLTPNYELTDEIIELLSREGNFLNSFRILAYWLNSDIELQENTLLSFFWPYASVVIPIIAFSALFFRWSLKYALIFSAMALTGIVLAMGTYSPLDYYDLVLSTPALAKFAWVLRDSDKLSFLITFAYSFLLGMASCSVFAILSRVKLKEKKKLLISSSILGCFSFLVIGSVYLISYPFYETRTDALKPVTLPTEFDRLNGYLSIIDTDKIFLLPYPLDETSWNNKSRVGDIYNTHSIKPSIESTEYNYYARNYYNYMVSSIMENRSKNIGDLIHPLGTSYVIFHNDTWDKIRDTYSQNSIELLKKFYFLEDIRNIENIGFYKIFRITNDSKSGVTGQAFIPSQSTVSLSGLDTFSSLNALTFNSLQSSVLFLDDIRTKGSNALVNNTDEFILNRLSTEDEFALFFVNDKYFIAPFDATYRFEPSEQWSKARARDPIHAEFHPYLNRYGIENWDLDYGKGLVMTSAMGAKISIPVEIKSENSNGPKDNNFNLFMRYLKNEKGGQIKIYLDDKLINRVDTHDRISNKFVWEKVNSFVNVTEGRHTLTLENVVGLNAVNILAIIPPDEMDRIKAETTHLLADKKQLIYLLEAESNFYNNRGNDSGSFYSFFGNDSFSIDNNVKNHTFTKTIKGQFKVPTNSDLLALQFMAKKNPVLESNYDIKDLKVHAAYKKHNAFTSDFELDKESVPLAILRHSDWINSDKDLVSTSLEVNEPLYGNSSLKLDIKGSNKTGWNILSTDLIPIMSNAYYNVTLDVFAKDVKDLHSRILYYDSDEKPMTGTTYYVFEHKDGNFRDTFTSSVLPPMEAKYLKFQVLTLSANPKPSSYILDNVKLDEITEPGIYTISDSDNIEDDKNTNVNTKDYLNTEINSNSTHFLIETKPLTVKENHLYNYTITTDSRNVPAYSGVALFKSSKDVVQNFTKYGNNASNGGVLSLSAGSEIITNLNVIESANYTIAIRAKTCQDCTFLIVEIAGSNNRKENNDVIQIGNVTLNDNLTGLYWKYTNSTYLKQGKYEIRIFSNSQVDVDSVVIYTSGNNDTYANPDNKDSKELDLFNLDKNLSKAYISGYKKINPTQHLISIKNATIPYVLAFAESYDPLWTAYSETGDQNSSMSTNDNVNFKVNSVPLYGVTNGFYINKIGDYSLIIEYQPQNWFVQGAKVSLLFLVVMATGLMLLRKRGTMRNLYLAVSKRLTGYRADKRTDRVKHE